MSLPPLFEPSGLPLFLAAEHGIDPDDVYSDFPRGSGENRKRRLATTAPRRVSVSRLLTPAQAVVYDDWFETNIVVGETHFSAQIANIEGPGQLWFDSCWLAPYQDTPIATPEGIFWRYTGSLLLTGDGTSVRPDDGTLAVEYSAFLRGEAAVETTIALAVEYSAFLTPSMQLAVEYAAGLDSTRAIFIPAPTSQITIAGLAPSVLRGTVVAPGPGAITVSGRAPTVQRDTIISPGPGAITVAGLAPAASTSVIASPGPGSITVTGRAPTANVVVNTTVSPGPGAITVAGVAPSIPPAGTAWDAVSGSPSLSRVTFSNGNKTATRNPTPAGNVSFKGSGTPKTSGKFYFEVECNNDTSSGVSWLAGLISSAASEVDFWQSQTANFAVRGNGQCWQPGVTFAGSLGVNFTTGDVIGFAVSVGVNVKVYKNNVLANTFTFTEASVLPYCSFDSGNVAQVATLLCVAADQHYAAPATYTAWG